jgi:hypothetical protein
LSKGTEHDYDRLGKALKHTLKGYLLTSYPPSEDIQPLPAIILLDELFSTDARHSPVETQLDNK